jgi:RNA polymerase sigma-70 factor (ECF subfamily)
VSSLPEILIAAPPETTAETSRARLTQMFDDDHEFIWRLLRRLGLSTEKADDAAQQVFLVAAERLSDIREGSERAFLFGSALRIGRTLLRRDHRMVLDGEMDCRLSHAATPEELADRRRAVDTMDRVLSGMDLDLRTVFTLFELEGLPVSEIASLTEMPAGTVASRLRRAREALRSGLSVLELGWAKERKQ